MKPLQFIQDTGMKNNNRIEFNKEQEEPIAHGWNVLNDPNTRLGFKTTYSLKTYVNHACLLVLHREHTKRCINASPDESRKLL